MSTVADLWAVQTTDLALDALKQRLAELEKQLGEPAEVQAGRASTEAARGELERWRVAQRELDRQIKELGEHIHAAEREMMSGRVRNPRELEGMEANVAALQRRRGGLEDEGLTALAEVENWQAQVQMRQQALAAAEAANQARLGSIKQEAAQKIADMKALSAKLQKQWQTIAPEDRELYKTMRNRKAGRPVALEQNAACQACGVMLPTAAVQAVRSGVQRVLCPGCGRLLLAKK